MSITGMERSRRVRRVRISFEKQCHPAFGSLSHKTCCLTLRSLALCVMGLVLMGVRGGTPEAMASAREAQTAAAEVSAEFQDMRSLAGRLYGESVARWQRILREELRTQEQNETARLQALRSEAAELQSAYAREFDETQSDLKTGSGSDRDLVVLSSALRALALMEAQQALPSRDQGRGQGRQQGREVAEAKGRWESARKLLAPLRREIRRGALRSDVRLFAGTVLVAADVHLEESAVAAATAQDVISLLEFGQPNRRASSRTANEALLLMFAGDALFELFRYRESLEHYQKSFDVAKSLGDENGQRLARMRIFWAAYRSGEFAVSMAAFRETCSEDVLYWETRASVDEANLFSEMGRLAGVVLMRSESDPLAAELAEDGRSGSCRARALASLIERLQGSGRFAKSIQVYKTHFAVLSQSPEFAGASLIVRAAADRSRPGIAPEEWRTLVVMAAPVLVRSGRWDQQTESAGEQNNRQRFVKDHVLEAADSYFDQGLSQQNSEAFQRSAQLYDVRLSEGDDFAARGRTEFRLAFALAQLDRRKVSAERLESALQTGLKGDDRKAALELRCDLAKREVWSQRSESTQRAWVQACLELVRAYPTARSLQALTDAVQDQGVQNPQEALQGLREGLGRAAAHPQELKQLSDRFLLVFRELLVQGSSGEERLAAFVQSEAMLRPALGVKRLGAFEQAHFSALMADAALLRSKGQMNPLRVLLQKWIEGNPSHSFLPAVRAELAERLYEIRRWPDLEVQTRQVLDVPEPQDQRTVRLEAGVDVDRPRLRLLRALAREGQLNFEGALSDLLLVEGDAVTTPSVVGARRILLERYADQISPAQRPGFVDRGLANTSGLTFSEKSQLHLLAWSWASSRGEPADQGRTVAAVYDRAREHLKGNTLENQDAPSIALAVAVDARSLLEGQPTASGLQSRSARLSPMLVIRVRNIVSGEVERVFGDAKKEQRLSLRQSRTARLRAAVVQLPSRLLTPRAGLAVAQSGRGDGVEKFVMGSLQARAAFPYEDLDVGVRDQRDAEILIEYLVRNLGMIPRAEDLLSFVGPNHPIHSIHSEGPFRMVTDRVAEGVLHESH